MTLIQFVILNFLLCFHNWLVQKDLITKAINNHMIKRQQTQLKHFLSEDTNPIFVLNEENKLEMNNEKAAEIFGWCGCSEVSLNTRLFLPLNSSATDVNASESDGSKISIHDLLRDVNRYLEKGIVL